MGFGSALGAEKRQSMHDRERRRENKFHRLLGEGHVFFGTAIETIRFAIAALGRARPNKPN